LYIKLAKEENRTLLENALSFALDYPKAKSKPKIFMWKLKELKEKHEKPAKPGK
jgi:predicted metal-dependent phosphoesterase TrpH